jgi:ankyrin repeat protein
MIHSVRELSPHAHLLAVSCLEPAWQAEQSHLGYGPAGCGDMETDLFDVAIDGDVSEVRRMVAAGADIEEQGELGMRPLHVAANAGHVEVITVLVEELGADKDAKNAVGWTPLHSAAIKGHVEAIKVLVELGVDKDP